MENTESMTRDEILEAIEQASISRGVPFPSIGAIRVRMERVARLADAYMDGEWDRQYLLESMIAAHKRFTVMVQAYS